MFLLVPRAEYVTAASVQLFICYHFDLPFFYY